MGKLTAEIKDFLAGYLAYVATASNKGVPNVVPKGDIAVLDEEHLVFADLYSHETKKNLKQNPNIAITIANPAGYSGYQIKGRAKIVEHGREYDRLAVEASGAGQLRHPQAKYAVKIKISKIINIGYGPGGDKEVNSR